MLSCSRQQRTSMVNHMPFPTERKKELSVLFESQCVDKYAIKSFMYTLNRLPTFRDLNFYFLFLFLKVYLDVL